MSRYLAELSRSAQQHGHHAPRCQRRHRSARHSARWILVEIGLALALRSSGVTPAWPAFAGGLLARGVTGPIT